MKIAQLMTYNSHKAGGLYNSVRCLSLALYHRGANLELFSIDDEYSKEDLYAYEDLPMVKYHCSNLPLLKQLAFSPDVDAILAQHAPDIIHSHGLWLYNTYATWKYGHKYGSKTIITPRGMLDSWALHSSRWKKALSKYLYVNKALRDADCILALNRSEYESVRKYGLKNPVAIIPNGISHPKDVAYDRCKDQKTLLFVGRINPKKGLSELLNGLYIIKAQCPDLFEKWSLRIAGWDEKGHIDYLRNKCKEMNLNEHVSFIGAILGREKERELLKADAYVLTSFSEGLPMSVLEAWAYELPVVMTKECNLPDGFENDAAIRVTTDPQSIAEGLVRLFMMSDEEREKMGKNGFDLVKREYTWEGIAVKHMQLYKWLLEGAKKPDFVLLD